MAAAAVAAALAAFVLRQPPLDVTATTVVRGTVEETVSAISSGTVKAGRDAMIAAEMLGTVVAIPAEEGQRVAEGDILIELSHTELDAQVALAQANLEAGRARLEQVRLGAGISNDVSRTQVDQSSAQLDQARADYERLRALAEQKAISASELERARLALRVAEETATAATAGARESFVREQEIRSAEATIKQLEAALAVAQAGRRKAEIRAPFAGTVALIHVDPGEAVTPGVPCVHLVQDATIYLEAPFDEANADQIAIGQRARINLDAYRETDFYGTVSYIAPIVVLNPDLSRTLNVRIQVKDEAGRFIPGMSADVVILAAEKADAVFAPAEALVREQFAYVIENGVAVRREITPGIGNWNRVEILEGLAEGEQLITSVSLRQLADGVPVRVVEALDER